MTRLAQWIESTTGIGADLQEKLFATVGTILVLWLIRFLVVRLILRRTEDVRARYRWSKLTGYVAACLGIFLVGRVWFEGVASLATFLGLLSAGLAIALKDVVADVAGWMFLMWRRPFWIGDRIQIGEFAGDVIDIRLFKFSLLEIRGWVGADQSTGRVLHVPNGMALSHTVASYNQGFQHIWNEVPVLVTFESNWRKAKEILQGIADKHAQSLGEAAQQRIREASKRFMIFYTTLTPTVYTSIRDSGVLLTLRYLCEPRRRRGTEQAICEDILDEFGKCGDVDFAYPTQRFYDNAVEGRPGARADSQ
ncbi:MAG TPA: mechanosensitive ion channel family protein [Planctomycetota bacterium]|nr:mechanosensitive ion channel family protein [Planctomycetota bacterium]